MILLLRHGETEFNLARRAQGAKDSPLTALGLRQAHAMAGLVHDLVRREAPGDWRLVSSPLGRARATAQVLAERLSLPVTLDDRIREHSMGELDGLTVEEFLPRFRTDVPPIERAFHTPGGESYAALCARVGAFLADIVAGERLIVVSHGSAGRVLRGLYAGLDMQQTLHLEMPQDAVHRLQNGQIDRFDCEAVE